MNEHERWSEDVAAYLLGVLEPGRATELERHAETCERCRQAMRWLAPAVDALPETAPRREPPPALRERLLAEVRADAAAAQGGEADAGPLEQITGWLRGAGPGRRWRPLAAGFAVVLVLIAGFVGYQVGSGGGGNSPRTYTGAENGITAEVVSEGQGAELNLAHVESLPPDKVLEAWVQREGEVEPVKALFVPDRDGNASTMIADMHGVEVVMVTREPQGGTSAPTSTPIVTVPIATD
ncbi:MAG TPA: anti-sigma factor [Solirubrobacterales bacterium]|nr:anti-sigma factor [Solirubrobacterales bacterium]